MTTVYELTRSEFASMAAEVKVLAADTANRVPNDTLQFWSSSGYARENLMEHHVHDARMFTITGGMAQILRTQVVSRFLDMCLPQTRYGYVREAARAKAQS